MTSARGFLANDQPRLGHDFGFEYDTIGNRLSSDRNGHAVEYSPDLLNQYDNRIGEVVHVLGEAHAEATVTVNQKPTLRQETAFYRGLELENETTDVYETVKITGVKIVDDPQTKNYVSEVERDVFLPKREETFVHDDDGNLEKDGRWEYEWNGENRLIWMQTRADLSSALPRQRLEFQYDADGRRIGKGVFEWDGTSFIPQYSTLFLYSGWNLLAEVTTSGDLIRSYLWGPSENGQVEFTATPGALLGLRDHATNDFYFTQADGNGNVTALIDASDGTVAARYEYGPFGEPLLAVGPMAQENPMRFSSKFTDAETRLFYYGYRYYSSNTGRWLNRDPIGEIGGKNIYALLYNAPVNFVDYLGLAAVPEPLGTLEELYPEQARKLDRPFRPVITIPTTPMHPDPGTSGARGNALAEALEVSGGYYSNSVFRWAINRGLAKCEEQVVQRSPLERFIDDNCVRCCVVRLVSGPGTTSRVWGESNGYVVNVSCDEARKRQDEPRLQAPLSRGHREHFFYYDW